MGCKQHNRVFLALSPLAFKNFSVSMFWPSAQRIHMYLFSCGILSVLKLLRPFFYRESNEIGYDRPSIAVAFLLSLSRQITFAKCCNEHVCISVCLHVSKTTCPSFTKFSVLITCSCGSVLLRRWCSTSFTSSCVDVYLESKMKNYQVCSVQYCVQQLCTVRYTHIWTDLTVLWIGFVSLGPFHCA